MVSNKKTKFNVMLIGCGQMGTALAKGWDKQNLLNSLYIKDPCGIPTELSQIHILFHVKQNIKEPLNNIDIVVLATKPQIMDEVCEELCNILPPNVPVLSIAAGKNIDYFQKKLGTHTPLIRAMPNIPASVGTGMSALYAPPTTDKSCKNISEQLMKAVGKTIWLENENLMDAVTALSGSGPAYIFYMIEAMAKAGENLGLPTDQAMQLARQTVIGAAKLAESKETVAANILRENVTSPSGTTEAALKILMDGQFQNLISEAIEAAKNRGKELLD